MWKVRNRPGMVNKIEPEMNVIGNNNYYLKLLNLLKHELMSKDANLIILLKLTYYY